MLIHIILSWEAKLPPKIIFFLFNTFHKMSTWGLCFPFMLYRVLNGVVPRVTAGVAR